MKKTPSRLLLLLAAVLLFASCRSYRLCYNQSPDFNEVVNKVYITAESVVSIEPFAKYFVGMISMGLSRRGVENETYFHDALSLKTEREVQEQIRAYGAKWHLDIRQREQSASGGDFVVAQSAFDLRLFDQEQDRILWRASLFGIQHNNRWLLNSRADFPCGTRQRSLDRAAMTQAERISAEIIEALSQSGIIP